MSSWNAEVSSRFVARVAGAALLACATILPSGTGGEGPGATDTLRHTGNSGGDQQLHVGLADADITPSIGKAPVYMAGFSKNRTALGVHDSLKVRAVVFKHGDKKIALACADVVGLFYDTAERVRKKLAGYSYVLVSSTHNHEGPDTMGLWGPTLFQSGIDAQYLQRVEDQFVAAIQAADAKLVAVQARIAAVRAPELVRDNREPYIKHDELVALQFQASGKNVGVLVQWNNHPETLDDGNRFISSDFVGSTVGYLQQKFACPVAYFTGTVGGLMTTLGLEVKDEQGALLKDGTYEKTLRYGELLGRRVERALADAEAVRLTPFEVRSRRLFLPIDNQVFKLAWALGVLKRQGYKWTGDAARAEPTGIDVAAEQRVCVATEVAWLRLGDLEIAAIPGEIYPELVLGKVQDPADPAADFPAAAIEPAIYAQMKARHRMIIGLANDELGYILPKRQWDEKRPFCYGRARAQYGEINSIGPDAGPALCETFRDLLK